jgi:hypothetical protein
MKEKWYVVVVTFQFASLCALNSSIGFRWLIANGRVNDIAGMLFFSFYFLFFAYLALHITRAGFVYMGCQWAGKAKPPRLDREKCWGAVLNGSLVSLVVASFAMNGDLWSILLGSYGLLFGVCINLWAKDEFRRDSDGDHAAIDRDHLPRDLIDDWSRRA